MYSTLYRNAYSFMLIEISGHIKCTSTLCVVHITNMNASNEAQSSSFNKKNCFDNCHWIRQQYWAPSSGNPFCFVCLFSFTRKKNNQPMSRCGTDKILCALFCVCNIYICLYMFFFPLTEAIVSLPIENIGESLVVGCVEIVNGAVISSIFKTKNNNNY